MGVSKATAKWNGNFKEGSGAMTPAHGPDVPFSVGTRFEGKPGSNPEEMIGAALAGCFSMALSIGLERAGSPPTSIRTSADVSLERVGEGFSITAIALTTEADVPGIDPAKFQQVAEDTKKACPVSKALAAVGNITLKASLTGR